MLLTSLIESALHIQCSGKQIHHTGLGKKPLDILPALDRTENAIFNVNLCTTSLQARTVQALTETTDSVTFNQSQASWSPRGGSP